jgi:adenosylhomocysteine nucleosidase
MDMRLRHETMKRIGIVAAIQGELTPLVEGWQQRGGVYTGRIGEIECTAVAGGMGAKAAASACELVLKEGPQDALISIGWAGALTCGVKPPSAFPISEVVDSLSGESYKAETPDGYRLLTLDHIARYDEKRKLAERYLTPLVDMEAVAVARQARDRKIPFFCFKAISDAYTDKLPDFNQFIGKDEQLRMPALISYALMHPQYWAVLLRLGQQSKAAASNLARLVAESIGQTL